MSHPLHSNQAYMFWLTVFAMVAKTGVKQRQGRGFGFIWFWFVLHQEFRLTFHACCSQKTAKFTSWFRYLGIGRRSACSTLPLWSHVFRMYLFFYICAYVYRTVSCDLRPKALFHFVYVFKPFCLSRPLCSHVSSSPLRYWSLFSSFTYLTGPNGCSVPAVCTCDFICLMLLARSSPSALVDVCRLFVGAVSLMYLMQCSV